MSNISLLPCDWNSLWKCSSISFILQFIGTLASAWWLPHQHSALSAVRIRFRLECCICNHDLVLYVQNGLIIQTCTIFFQIWMKVIPMNEQKNAIICCLNNGAEYKCRFMQTHYCSRQSLLEQDGHHARHDDRIWISLPESKDHYHIKHHNKVCVKSSTACWKVNIITEFGSLAPQMHLLPHS